MFDISKEFHDRLERGEIPTPYIVIETHLGYRAYAEKELTVVFDLDGYLLNGSWLLDGSVTLGSGSAGVIEKGGRVISFGGFERAIQPAKADLLTGYVSKQRQHFSVTLTDADNHFSRMQAVEPFLGRPLGVYVGFEDMPQSTHVKVFDGCITEIVKNGDMSFTVEADER